MQGVHRRVTGFGANPQFASRRPRIRRGVSLSALTEIDMSVEKTFSKAVVKITHLPCPARALDSNCMWDSRTRLSSSAARRVEIPPTTRFVCAVKIYASCRCWSSAPSGLAHFPLTTHGLRRGLYSFAAWRLETADFYFIARLRNPLLDSGSGSASTPQSGARETWPSCARRTAEGGCPHINSRTCPHINDRT